MNEQRFLYARRMELAGFDAKEWYGGLAYRMLEDEPVQKAFDRFSERVLSSVSREFLPVYRMADGEFEFLTGKVPVAPDSDGVRRLVHTIATPARRVARLVRFHTVWGETYYAWQRAAALTRLRTSIRHIAERGYLALYFVRRADGWSEEYFTPACEWLDRNGITLTRANYVPFYAVYALLSGPRRWDVFGGRTVLVVTHLTASRRTAIENGLRDLGANAVEFIGISGRGALFETIDVSKVERPIDVALVAAGIGSAPILTQLEPLRVPALDAGMWIDCLVDPARREERPFLRFTELTK